VEVAVVMEAAAGARWRTESPAVAADEARAHPFVGTPEGRLFVLVTPHLRTSSFWSPTYFILLHYKTRLGKPSSGRWEEGKEGAHPCTLYSCSVGVASSVRSEFSKSYLHDS